MPGQHSTIIGGSTASRVVNCPGSVIACAELPPSIRDEPPSIYATEGTACHMVMSDIVLLGTPIPPPGTVITVPNEGDVVITQELIHDCIEPAVAYINSLLDEMGDDAELFVEQRVAFPGIKGAFGTLDVAIVSRRLKRTKIVDFKFGAGVGVQALYPDPGDPDMMLVNEQLLFYLASAHATWPKWFPKGGRIDISICQPRAVDVDNRITTAPDITLAEIAEFKALVHHALELAAQPDAMRKKGPWCRFAPCKTTCPLWLDPLHGMVMPAERRPTPSQLAPEFVGAILDAAPRIEELFATAREQARALLEAGHDVPGWKLVPKRATRVWQPDEKTLLKILRRFGIFKRDAFNAPVLKSPAQMEKLRKGGLPAELWAAVSSGTTLAAESDHRPSTLTLDKLLARVEGDPLFADSSADDREKRTAEANSERS